jgi:hypothetical protein
LRKRSLTCGTPSPSTRDPPTGRTPHRGGDRQANAALYRIAITRLRCDQQTRDYVDQRTSEGNTSREAIRCRKRYIAREIYTLIRPATTPAATTINTSPVAA